MTTRTSGARVTRGGGWLAVATIGLAAGLSLGGCPGGSILGFNTVTVEIVNDTAFDVAPNIEFDDDDGLLAGIFPADDLNTGLIAPGEIAVFTFECDELGTIRSNDPEQVSLFGDETGDDSPTLEREEEFDCGDLIRFRYVGEGIDFGVIVSVNNRIVG